MKSRTSGYGALCIWKEAALCDIMDETDRLKDAGGQRRNQKMYCGEAWKRRKKYDLERRK